ncbi:MAG: TIGR00159 family protein [Chlorobi bacterium]|nr:MAG: TIGR00159 family protein [Bacteroidota bacterium]KXK35286.1 MAG: DNA integrity scanning protein DisA [Chlorobi bacterium OLB6]MBE2264907.1 TIGR00159 family protein [Flavobacteriales bacterium]MBL1160596.1 TIGR00159 family protein [Chlorobiota bacterium]MBW7853156.1 TIGR00159 family protein [Candidatus Kapabacteria bacterium]MCC6331355.1 TIGR00159 family protein [Ignavibacteria bacterium]
MIELFGFLPITLMDIADILIISILFFIVYRSLRDTAAIQIIVVLAVLAVLGIITEAANLRTVNWVLRRIADIGLIAFVVLFQPELRRLLLLVTQTRLFRLFVRSSNANIIDDVCNAAKEMSAKHIGALLVFARADHIRVIVETGVELQAALSPELLLSVFNPRSPLHDGAVVIDGQTVVAARCVLPLSAEQKAASRTLGTRHRAAVGVTEQADAVCLVVSEESGAVSIAYQGELEHNILLDELPSKLSERISLLAST